MDLCEIKIRLDILVFCSVSQVPFTWFIDRVHSASQARRQEMKWGGGCKKVDLSPTKWNKTESHFAL